MVKKEDLQIIRQLIFAMDQASEVLQNSYLQKNITEFNKAKNYILDAKKRLDIMLNREIK